MSKSNSTSHDENNHQDFATRITEELRSAIGPAIAHHHHIFDKKQETRQDLPPPGSTQSTATEQFHPEDPKSSVPSSDIPHKHHHHTHQHHERRPSQPLRQPSLKDLQQTPSNESENLYTDSERSKHRGSASALGSALAVLTPAAEESADKFGYSRTLCDSALDSSSHDYQSHRDSVSGPNSPLSSSKEKGPDNAIEDEDGEGATTPKGINRRASLASLHGATAVDTWKMPTPQDDQSKLWFNYENFKQAMHDKLSSSR